MTYPLILIYDINYTGLEEIFANCIINFNQFNNQSVSDEVKSSNFQKSCEKSDFQFGFIPLFDEQMSLG